MQCPGGSRWASHEHRSLVPFATLAHPKKEPLDHAALLYRCPNTGDNVQAWAADDPEVKTRTPHRSGLYSRDYYKRIALGSIALTAFEFPPLGRFT